MPILKHGGDWMTTCNGKSYSKWMNIFQENSVIGGKAKVLFPHSLGKVEGYRVGTIFEIGGAFSV